MIGSIVVSSDVDGFIVVNSCAYCSMVFGSDVSDIDDWIVASCRVNGCMVVGTDVESI